MDNLPPDVQQRLQALQEAKLAADARKAAALAKAAEAAASPEAIVAQATRELDAAERDAAAAERQLVDDAAYTAACAKHGGEDRVARVRTQMGAILIRPMEPAEVDNATKRESAQKDDLAKELVARDEIRKLVIHPSQERFAQIVQTYPLLWNTLGRARDALIKGLEEQAGKDGAR